MTGFHLTLECIRGLRRGVFDGVVNQERSVFRAMNLIYVTMFWKFYQGWKVRSYKNHIESIQHFGTWKTKVVENILKNPTKAIESLRSHQQRQNAKQ